MFLSIRVAIFEYYTINFHRFRLTSHRAVQHVKYLLNDFIWKKWDEKKHQQNAQYYEKSTNEKNKPVEILKSSEMVRKVNKFLLYLDFFFRFVGYSCVFSSILWGSFAHLPKKVICSLKCAVIKRGHVNESSLQKESAWNNVFVLSVWCEFISCSTRFNCN